jgi:hypothetical protein
VSHARADTVNWRCGGIYAAAGVIGALPGSSAGKAFDGQSTALPFRSPEHDAAARDRREELAVFPQTLLLVHQCLTENLVYAVLVSLEERADLQGRVPGEIRDVLTGENRVRLSLIRLAAQPCDDRDAVVAEDHETVPASVEPALSHHCDEISVAQPVGDVPANTQFNNLALEPPAAVDRVAGSRWVMRHSSKWVEFYAGTANAPEPA